MKTLSIIFLFFFISTGLFAQKVALVLSGGGAKGIAHVSVLKELEKHHIPIDYVVGTSMGAVVGGFYAAGYSPEEIEAIVLSPDFQNWINGEPGTDFNYHFIGKDPNASFFSVDFKVKESFSAKLNTTIASDAVINFKLAEYLAPASQASNDNFDSLFVPFRAIAADIFTQQEEILKTGSLQKAIRASMAVPFFYKPIKGDNDKMLFDGGIYNNFPVDIAQREFHPDIIIGVNVSTPVFDTYPYETDEDLLDENLFIYLLNKSDPGLLSESDIYIEPDLKGYSATDFSKVTQFLDSGRISIYEKMAEIEEKILRRKTAVEVENSRNDFLGKQKEMVFSSIQFEGFNSKQMNYLKSIFMVPKRSSFSIQEITRGYYKLISEEFFTDIYPAILFDYTDSTFVFQLTGKQDQKLKLDVGGFLTSRNISELYVGLRYNSFNSFLSEHSISIYTGRFYQSVDYFTRFYFSGKQSLYIEPKLTFNQWDYIDITDLFQQYEASSFFVKQQDLKAGLNVAFPLGLKNKLIIGGFYMNNTDQYSNTPEIQSNDLLDKLQFEGLKIGASISRNSLNRRLYASKGSCLLLKADYFDGKEYYVPGTTSVLLEEGSFDHNWIRARIKWEKYVTLRPKFSYGWIVESVMSSQPNFTNYEGTLLNLPAYNPLNDSKTLILPNFRAFSYFAGGLRGIYTPLNRLDFRLETYLFTPLIELVEVESQIPEKTGFEGNLYFAGTFNVVFRSPVGPISLALNYYDQASNRWGLMFHLGYLLFNNRSNE